MPMSQYDKEFGGKPGSAEKARRAMTRTYGKGSKAREVFYATKNKRRKQRLTRQSEAAAKAEAQRRFFTGHERRTY